jgi:hypothetical protein
MIPIRRIPVSRIILQTKFCRKKTLPGVLAELRSLRTRNLETHARQFPERRPKGPLWPLRRWPNWNQVRSRTNPDLASRSAPKGLSRLTQGGHGR